MKTNERIADLRNNIKEMQANCPAGDSLDEATAALLGVIETLKDGTYQECPKRKPAPITLEIRNAGGFRVA